MSLPILRWDSGFNPRTPCGVRRLCLSDNDICEIVSIHALLAECDLILARMQPRRGGFNPRTPCGVRLCHPGSASRSSWFQSTHSLRSATEASAPRRPRLKVSIHALLAECDATLPATPRPSWSFNPRTPCGVRHGGQREHKFIDGFNPRTPCGVRLRLTIYIVIQQRKRYFAPTSRRRPSSPSLLF